MVKCLEFFFQSYSECYISGIFFRFGQILLNLACTFAAHHEKSFITQSFKISIDHLFDNLESGKRKYSIFLVRLLYLLNC